MKVARNKKNTVCVAVVILQARRLYETQDIIENSTKIHLFANICFCMKIMLMVAWKDVSFTDVGVVNCPQRVGKMLTGQPEEHVDLTSDVYEWKRRGIFLLVF